MDIAELQPFAEHLQAAAPQAQRSAELAAAQLELARLVLRRLHQLALAGRPREGEDRALFDNVLAAAAATHPDAERDEFALQAESLRALLGDWREALEGLRPIAVKPRYRMRALKQMFDICSQHRCIAEGFPLFTDLARGSAAATDPIEIATIHRYRCALLTIAGLLDGAAHALAAAKATALPAADSRTPGLRALLMGSELDLLLATERFDSALAAAARMAATADLPAAELQRAQLGTAIARLRLGDDDAARPLLEDVVASRAAGRAARAAVELALLHLRRGDRLRARTLLATARAKPLDGCDDHELGALAWLALADLDAGDPPDTPLPALRDALLRGFHWMLTQWDAAPLEAGGIAFLQLGVRRDLLAALCAVTLQLEPSEAGVQTCLDHVLAAEARGSAARALGLPPRSFAAARAAVAPADGALLVYLPALTRSWLFTATPAGLAAHALPGDVSLRRAVRRLVDVAFAGPDGDPDELAAAAQALADWCLPADVRRAIEPHAMLAIVGRELTAGVPFECLPWSGGWLGCAKALWCVPSMTLLHATRSAPLPLRSLDLAVLAAGKLTAADARRFGTRALPITASDLRAIAAAVAPQRVALLPTAGCDDLVRGAGAAAHIAVVLAHGIIDPERVYPSGLLLGGAGAGTGAVFADDLHATADLLLLGSCGLGGGGAQRGEDGGHRFGGALLQRGARAVLLADGELGLAPTQQLFAAYIAALAEGVTAAEGARRARAVVHATPGRAAPWFHAQLRLEGDGQLRVALTPGPAGQLLPWPWLALFVALAAALVVALGRGRRGNPA